MKLRMSPRVPVEPGLHEKAILSLLESGWQRALKNVGKKKKQLNWNNQLRKVVKQLEYFQEICDCIPYDEDVVQNRAQCVCDYKSHLLPDLFQFDYDNKTVKALEVEYKHPVAGARLRLYADLWWMFDDDSDWFFELWLFDVRDNALRKFDFVSSFAYIEAVKDEGRSL